MTLKLILTKDPVDLKWYDIAEFTAVHYWSSILLCLYYSSKMYK